MKRLLTYLLLVLGLGLMFTNFASALPECKGTYSKKWTNCQGTLTAPDGAKYVGGFKNGKEHGQGTSTWTSGEFAGHKYVGEYKNGNKHGQGTYTWTDGGKYVGEFKKGKGHGQGTRTWPGGDKYVGKFKNGKRHGEGTYTQADGTVHKGIWKIGKIVKVITREQAVSLLETNTLGNLNLVIDKNKETKIIKRNGEYKQVCRFLLKDALGSDDLEIRTSSEIKGTALHVRSKFFNCSSYGCMELFSIGKRYKFESDGKVSEVDITKSYGSVVEFSEAFNEFDYHKAFGKEKFIMETMMSYVDDFATGPKKYGYKLTAGKKSIDIDDMEDFNNLLKTLAAQSVGKLKITGAYKKLLKNLTKDTKYSLYEEYLGSTEIDNETFYLLKTVREFKYSGKNEEIKAWLEFVSGGFIYFIHADSGFAAAGYNLKSTADNIDTFRDKSFLNRVCSIYKNNKRLTEISLKELLN